MKAEMDEWRHLALAKIHVGRKRLGLDDAAYRDLLLRVTGQASARDLNLAHLGLMLDEMKRLGFREGNSQGARIKDLRMSKAQFFLIDILWDDLRSMGALRHGSETGLRRFIKRVSGCDSIRWMGPAEASKVIEALKAWHQREKERRRPKRESAK